MPPDQTGKTKHLPGTPRTSVPAPGSVSLLPSVNTLLSTPQERRPELPLSDDLRFLRDAISRFIADGIYLLAGVPSGGKSLLATQIGLDLGRQNIHSLFVLTEQGSSNLKETAMRITTDWDERDVERALDATYMITVNIGSPAAT